MSRLFRATLLVGAVVLWLCAACVALAFVTSCAGPAGAADPGSVVPVHFETSGIERMTAAAVRIRVYCNGELAGYGSGTAIGPRHLVTARHLLRMCEDGRFTAQFDSGMRYEISLVAGASNEDVDAALFANVERDDFKNWAQLAGYQPRRGQQVFFYTGDGWIDTDGEWPFQIKEGRVSFVRAGTMVVSTHGVPGNSGCGVFDADGALLGVLWGGRWDARTEFYIEAFRPQAWSDIARYVLRYNSSR